VERRRLILHLLRTRDALLGTLAAIALVHTFALAPDAHAQRAPSPVATAPSGVADLLRARAEVVHAERDLQRARALGQRGMLSDAELDDRTLGFDRARAEYLRSALGLIAGGRHVVIERAAKRRLPNGSVLVRIDVAPLAGDSVFALPGPASAWDDLARATEIRNLVVSLKSDAGPNGAAIGRPYERVIPHVRAGERIRVEFELLEDVAEVVIATTVGDRAEERRVRLENDASLGGVSMRAAQFSLEGDLGTEIVYDLTLEPSGVRPPVMRFDVVGLPAGVRYEFRDAVSKTRIVQLRMPEGVVAQHLQLAVTLPGAASAVVHADSLVRFAVVALADAAPDPGTDPGPSVAPRLAPNAMPSRELARVPLEIIGRGSARVDVQPASLFLDAAPGALAAVPVRLQNVGSRALGEIRLTAENGAQWPIDIVPAVVAGLLPGESRTVNVAIHPPAGTQTGDYEVRLSVQGDVRERRAESDDKVLRVRVTTPQGMLGTGLIAAFAIAAVAVVVFARRLVYR
jgi:hypothetical protein